MIILPCLGFLMVSTIRYTSFKNLGTGKNNLSLALIIGFVIYLIINYIITDNPIMFMTYQREHWFRYFRVPWEGIWQSYERIYNPKPTDAQMVGVQEFLFVIMGLVSTIAGWRYLRNSYRVWMATNWLLFVSTSYVLSVPRYTITLFPIFILMALAARRNWYVNVLFIVWSILFLSLFTTQFVRGWWAF